MAQGESPPCKETHREGIMRTVLIAAAAGLTAVLGGFACAEERPPEPNRTDERAQPCTAGRDAADAGSAPIGQKGQNETGANGATVDVTPRSASGGAHIDRERAAKIASALIATAAPQNVSAHITVGAPLPGEVDLRPLPPGAAQLAPEYHGFDYVVVHDQVAIVDPTTRRVVELIEVGAGEHAANTDGSGAARAVRGCS
jgi:hypothetical protein